MVLLTQEQASTTSTTDFDADTRQDDDLAHAFKNFDDPEIFRNFEQKIRNYNTRNFVINFGDDEAYCAVNLSGNNFTSLLRTPRTAALHTRWINIWLPQKQKDTIESIAQYYDFSPRLLAVMLSDPVTKVASRSTLNTSHSTLLRRFRSHGAKDLKNPDVDIEKASLGSNQMNTSLVYPLQDMFNHYQIVDEVWHWSSIDWGRRFVCLGYNSLYAEDSPQALNSHQDLPEATRVWTWLLLCEDSKPTF
jgi:hypothetical protein